MERCGVSLSVAEQREKNEQSLQVKTKQRVRMRYKESARRWKEEIRASRRVRNRANDGVLDNARNLAKRIKHTRWGR